MSEKGEKGDVSDALNQVKLDKPDQEIGKNQAISDDVDNTTKSMHHDALNSYIHEWQTYFIHHKSDEDLVKNLKSKAFKDSLRSCTFRSICWRVFLGCLPASVTSWQEALRKSRDEYEVIKAKHVTNPHDEAKGSDLQLENPLSLNDHSCWSQYFKNNELKNMIERDVRRTWPEMDFFHLEEVRELMASVLFCYAREHESLSYRQGMHELLAPLLFVLHCDLQGVAHAKEMGNLPETILTILDDKYLEHDVYSMFCQVMNATNPWYSVTGEKKSDDDDDPQKPAMPIAPFQSNENAVSSTPLAITNKLKRIHKELLAEFDPELFQHLNRLEIIPQVYGLRWVRLLFGREFDLQDLLVLWDALFADSSSLDLVDYIFVAMMFNIRHELLTGDYCKCMQLLMKYPPIEDIYDMVHLAVFYRDPKNNKRPAHMIRKLSSEGPAAAAVQIPTAQPVKKKILPTFKLDNPFSNISLNLKKSFRNSPPRAKHVIGAPPTPDLSVRYHSIPEQEIDGPTSPSKIEQRLRSLSGLDSMKAKKNETEILQNQVEVLKQQLQNLQEKCSYCSDKIDASIRLLQPHLVKGSVAEETPVLQPPGNGDHNVTVLKNEEQLVALANLKQIRDMLRGSLSYMEKKPRSHSFDVKVDQSGVNFQASSVHEDWTMLERPRAVN